MSNFYNDGERPAEEEQSSVIRSKKRYETVQKFLSTNSRVVVDFGCGLGYGYEIINPHVLSYIGIDKSKEVIEEARKKHKLDSLDSFCYIEKISDITAFSFNFFIALEVLEHLEKDEVENLLKIISVKGAPVYFTTPNGNFYPYHPETKEQRHGHHIWHYTHEELEVLFRNYFNYVDIFALEYDKNIDKFVTYGIYAKKEV